ncbi:MAG: hypothetical protein JNL70_16030 [Saprospiraceae bacterium]|nr:hypothetical protein [Saprospiraceae bacterium]
MKNSIIIAAIAFVATFAINNANANTYLPTTPTLSAGKIKVTVTVNFGKRSKGCTGFGVCSIVISAELARPSNNSGSGSAEVKDGKLVVTLNKASMTQEALAKYFAGGKFTVEEDVAVSEAIVSPRDPASGQATGRRQYTIKKGVYNVQDGGSTLTIVF